MWDIIPDLKAYSLKKILKILLVKNFIIGCSKKKLSWKELLYKGIKKPQLKFNLGSMVISL